MPDPMWLDLERYVSLIDPEEHKKVPADRQLADAWGRQAAGRNEGENYDPETSVRDPPSCPNRAVPFPNRVIKYSKKSKKSKARLAIRLAYYFRKGESQLANTIANLENKMDLDKIY